ncbi:unnamed protein product [Vitrella brassicaformis CCMP3155]|uniref:Aminoglycoside phosphotransferase domain-containing protein n=1 Tax=Vitrella brassicaformis (strain CCMP3155) TaxID=1169540 RepID=A0A0G4FUB1_VITBC|nr:unnamed protein product [Vitrella brassicaformis CCMP3155]|eukprot:CEM18514.1 unnamed protein product [Vitrella brassicaformis CCMP3155]
MWVDPFLRSEEREVRGADGQAGKGAEESKAESEAKREGKKGGALFGFGCCGGWEAVKERDTEIAVGKGEDSSNDEWDDDVGGDEAICLKPNSSTVIAATKGSKDGRDCREIALHMHYAVVGEPSDGSSTQDSPRPKALDSPPSDAQATPPVAFSNPFSNVLSSGPPPPPTIVADDVVPVGHGMTLECGRALTGGRGEFTLVMFFFCKGASTTAAVMKYITHDQRGSGRDHVRELYNSLQSEVGRLPDANTALKMVPQLGSTQPATSSTRAVPDVLAAAVRPVVSEDGEKMTTHNDCHPGNVVLADGGNGEAGMIDFESALNNRLGPPCTTVGNTQAVLEGRALRDKWWTTTATWSARLAPDARGQIRGVLAKCEGGQLTTLEAVKETYTQAIHSIHTGALTSIDNDERLTPATRGIAQKTAGLFRDVCVGHAQGVAPEELREMMASYCDDTTTEMTRIAKEWPDYCQTPEPTEYEAMMEALGVSL